MFSFNLSRWLKNWTRRRVRTIEYKPRLRLALEELESRLAPASIWTGGGGAANNWLNPLNWQGGASAVPTIGAPVDLVFNSSALNFTSVNDIPGLTVNQFTVASGNYTFSAANGATFTLGNPGSNTGTFIVNTGATATSSIDMIIGTAAPSTAFIDVQSAASMTYTGRLSGNSASNLVRQGAGLLTLTNDNRNFLGSFEIDNTVGNGVVQINNAFALGGAVKSEVQTLSISGATAATRFTLTYANGTTNPATAALALTGLATDATNIQTALNTLLNSQGFSGTPVTVTRTASATGSATFALVFTAGVNFFQFNPTITVGPGSASSTTAAEGLAPNFTTVTTNTQLVINVPGGTILNPLSLNGAGPGGLTGALANLSGTSIWAGNIVMNSANGVNSTTIGVNTATTLEIRGQISNTVAAGYTLEKIGAGTLYLNPQNTAGNTYQATTNINAGVLSIGHPFALGPAGAATNVLTNAQQSGAFALNYTGNTTIPVQYQNRARMQTLSFTGATPGTTQFRLTFNGVQTTTPIVFNASAAGATAIQTALNALTSFTGIGGVNQRVTVAFNTSTGNFEITFFDTSATPLNSLVGLEVPTIEVDITAGPGSVGYSFGLSPTVVVGFETPDVALVLNGNGTASNTFANLAGHNIWTRGITLNGTNFINVANNTNFTMAGAFSNGTINANGPGRLILPTVNNFTGAITMTNTIVNIRDSQALGRFNVTVPNGSTLELQADSIPDSIGAAGLYNLYFPSSIAFSFTGPGRNNVGALLNVSGVNQFAASPAQSVTLANARIGVSPDPDPFNRQQTTYNSLSQLIVNGVMGGASGGVALTKVGFGELVLTNANTYTTTANGRVPGVTPQTQISQGWITVQNSQALGGVAAGTSDTTVAPVQVDPTVAGTLGAALVLKQDLSGNNLRLANNIVLNGFGISHRFSWLNQRGALVNLAGSNLLTGYIYLSGAAGIGVVLDGGAGATPPISELTLSGTGSAGAAIADGTAPGQLVKLGSERLINNNPGTYTAGVDVREGVLRIANDTALGLGTPATPTTSTVNSGAALEIAPTAPQFSGGLQRGLQIWYTRLVLNGTGNSTFGSAPLTILGGDVGWRGPLTLNANIAVSFKNQLANMALPTMGAITSALIGGGTLTVNTTTPGSSGINAVQTLTFTGTITGGTFQLIVTPPNGNPVTTAPITWSANLPVLIANIQTELNNIASNPAFGGTVAAGIANVGRNSPRIDIAPSSRLVVTGVIDDTNPADLSISGSGELLLTAANTYRGTTFVDQGIVTILNSQALGGGAPTFTTPFAETQQLTLSGVGTIFTLAFNGSAPSSPVTFTGTAADLPAITAALNSLPTIGGVGATINVSQAGSVFTITLGGSLAGFDQMAIIATKTGGPAAGTATIRTITDGMGGTVVASGAQLQLQGSINVANEPLRIQGVGTPAEPEVQTFTVTGTAGAFNLLFTNPNTSTTSTSIGLPAGASALQVQAALNAMAAIQQGSGSGGGFVEVTESGAGVYRVTYRGSFTGATNLPVITAAPTALQILTVAGTSGSFRLSFTGTPALQTSALAPNVQPSGSVGPATSLEDALNALLANAGAPGGGTGTAKVLASGTPGIFQITFGGSLAGASVPLLVAGNFLGNTTASVTSVNSAQTFSGRLLPGGNGTNTPTQWFNVGPAPINNGQVSTGANTSDVTGRVTSVIVDPNDANNITIATAGGGAWRTNNSAGPDGAFGTADDVGARWAPLFDGVSAVQSLRVSGSSGTFTMSFTHPITGVSATTAPLPYNATADQVQAALNGLSSIGGNGDSVAVSSVTTPGVNEVQRITLPGAVASVTMFTVSFGAAITAPIVFTGTISDALAIESALNSATFATIGGVGGVVTVTQTAVGTFSIRFGGTLAQQPASGLLGAALTAGPGTPGVTLLTAGVRPFITHAISFSGGSFANTPLATSPVPSFSATASGLPTTATVTMVANGLSTSSVMFAGAVAQAPSSPSTFYLGTGEGNNNIDNYYGTGVYVSRDYGQTWALVTGSNGNPLNGLAVTKIVVDATNPNRIYVSTADRAVNSHNSTGGPLSGAVGVWRFDAGTNLWTNITAAAFPTTVTNYTWSDLLLTPNGGLYAAGGKAGAGTAADAANLVYVSTNPAAATPTWTTAFPGGGTNGNIKMAVVPGAAAATDRVYAAVANAAGGLQSIQVSTNSGASWAATAAAPANYLATLGYYASAIAVRAVGTVDTIYVGGVDSGTGLNFILVSPDNGATWPTDISRDASGNGPHTDIHSMTIDRNGNLIVGTDGGVWRFNIATNTWSNLNGNLAIANVNGIATNPTNLNNILIGTRNNGTNQFSGTLNWRQVDTGDGGIVLYDPNNPLIAYHDRDVGATGTLMRSTDGGATWLQTNPVINSTVDFPFAIFSGSSFLVIGGTGLRLWPGTGIAPTNLVLPPALGITTVTALGISTNQGAYQNDPSFTTLTDLGADNPDPRTIYITGGNTSPLNPRTLFVTKDLGLTWSGNRAPTLIGNTIIQSIVVDPTNRDHVYIITSGNDGGRGFTGQPGVGRVFESKNAGQSWTDISAGLPDSPAWSLVIDSRNSDLYLGNDVGVYKLDGGVVTATNAWQRFGANLPYVSVHNLELNQSLNVLTAGTYGRSVYQFFLSDSEINSGALRAAGGSNIWNGPIILTGPTTISAQGTTNLNNGLAVSQLSILGTISDLTAAQTTSGANTLTKVGLGDVILAGANTYGGHTYVNEGHLVIQNPNALGSALQGTTVKNGAVLELNTSLNAEPLFLFGNGIQTQGHFTGALENANGNNTYNGPLTLMSNATIGVKANSSLSIIGPGTITNSGGSHQLTKEGPGTLTLATSNTYQGGTAVNQGVLNVQNNSALGAAGGTTSILDGAQLQLQAPAGGPLSIANQNLILSGSGGNGSGAILNVSGINTWTGNVTITSLQSFGPGSVPGGAVVFGVANAAETLTIGSPIGELASTEQGLPASPLVPMATGLTKVGPGTLVLSQANTYSGTTRVDQGILRIQNSSALGLYGGKAVQRLSVADPRTTDTFRLSFNGFQTSALNVGSSAAQVQNALNALTSIGANGVHVSLNTVFSGISAVQTMSFSGAVANVTQFRVSFNGVNSTPILFTGVAGGPTGDAAAIRNALDLLTTPGTFTVDADPSGTIFTITFGGNLQKSFQPRIGAQIITSPGLVDVTDTIDGVGVPVQVYTIVFDSPALAGQQPLVTLQPTLPTQLVHSVSTVADGSFGAIVAAGATLGLDGDPLHTGASISIPALESVALNGTGVSNLGALRNFSGNNTWNGSIYLQTDASIGADVTTRLSVAGVVRDKTPAPVAPASLVPSNLSKVGPGTLAFQGGNTYTGNTTISSGILNIQHPTALGISPSTVQTLTITGTTGNFTLFFSDFPIGVTTGALPFNVTQVALQAALNSATMLGNAAAPGNGAGTATVVQRASGNIFDITFGGSLAGVRVPLLIAPAANFTGNTVASTTLTRSGGTSRTIVQNGAALQMENAAGFSEASGKSLSLAGTGVANGGALQNMVGSNVWSASRIVLAANAAIGVSGGFLNIAQTITDADQTQSITFNGFSLNNLYSLTFNGATTPNLAFDTATATNVTRIQNALNALATVALPGGNVVVTFVGGNSYRVAFTGAMGGQAWPNNITAATVTGTGTFTIGAASTPPNPTPFGVTKVGPGVLTYSGTTSNSYTGLTDVNGGTLLLQKSAGVIAVAGNLQVGDVAPVLQVQTLTLAGFTTGNQFRLTYNGNTTAPITYSGNATFAAAAIEAAFNLPSILGAGNTASVAATATPGVFRVTFGGAMAGTNPSFLITGAPVSPATGTVNSLITTAGVPFAAFAAIARLQANNQTATTTNVLVNRDGFFDLNSRTNTVTNFTITGGVASTGISSGGVLNVTNLTITDGRFDLPGDNALINIDNNLSMTGGVINLDGIGSKVQLNTALTKTVTATSSATTGDAEINGVGGTLDLGGFAKTFNVTHAAASTSPSDLFIRARVTGAAPLIKSGAGRLELSADNTYTGGTRIDAGDLQVDEVGQQTLTLTGFSAGATTFNLTYSNNTQSGTTSAIGYTGTPATDAASILSALVNLLSSLVVPGSVNVTPVSATAFTILFSGGAQASAIPLLATVTAGPGSASAKSVNTIGDVTLNGGTLTGTGTTGAIAMTSPTSTGVVNPGIHGVSPVTTGILEANGAVTWTSNSTFFVHLSNASGTHPNARPGADHDQLYVDGAVDLGNALLDGNILGGNLLVNDRFTILRSTGAITGSLDGIIAGVRAPIAQDGAVFLNGQKFTLHYFTNSVVLTRQTAVFSSFSFVSSANPSVYGQEVTYTITAVPETGATLATANPIFTVTIDGFFTLPIQVPTTGPNAGIVNFKPQQAFGFVWAANSTHTIAVAFSDTFNVFAPATPPTVMVQQVNKNAVTIGVTSNPASSATAPVYGQNVNVIGALTPVVPINVNGGLNPTGNVRFVVDAGSASPLVFVTPIQPYSNPPAILSATATILGSLLLSPGLHTVDVTYLGVPGLGGDANYFDTVATPTPFSFTILKDNSVVTFLPPPAPITLGQNATLSVAVTPAHAGSTGQPQGTVTFYDGSTSNPALGSVPVTGTGIVNFNTNNFASAGPHTIIAVYTPTDINYNGSQNSAPLTINAAPTQTLITSTVPVAPTFGQQITFNINVAANPLLPTSFGTPTGTVELWDGAVGTGTLIGTSPVNPSTGAAVISTSVTGLSAGSHTINTIYLGDTKFAASTGTVSPFVVNGAATTTVVTASPTGSANHGATVTLTAQVTSPLGPVPVNSDVRFWDGPVGGISLGIGQVDATGTATINISSLTAGVHTINAVFVDDVTSNYASSTGTLTGYRINNAATSTVLTANVPSGTGVYGQPITLQATVSSPGGTVNVGSVTFRDGTTTIGSALVNGLGIATLTINSLTAGAVHNLSAAYVDNVDSSFLPSTGNLNNYAVNTAATQILPTDFTSSAPIATQGLPVTLTAKVTTQGPSTIAVTSGTVTFWNGPVGGINLGTSLVNASGVATLTRSDLPLGTLTINAIYNGISPNYLASVERSLTQIVRRATTIAFGPIAAPYNFFGLTLDYTVNIAPATTIPPGPAPTGTLTISEIISGTPTVLFTLPSYIGGDVQMPVTGLTAGAHTLVLNYSGDTVYAPSSRTITQTVVAAPTTTTLDPLFATFFGNAVTFTATVASDTASSPTAGSVTFRDTYQGVTTTLAVMPLMGSNVAQFTTSAAQLRAGSHTIVAVYSNTGNPNYASSSASSPQTQIVAAATTETALDPLTDSFYGNSVTFRATVSVTSPGSLLFPTGGSITFRKTTGTITTVLGTVAINSSGVATFTTAKTALGVGSHMITATYNGSAPNFAASLAAAGTQTVKKAGVNIAITPSVASGTITYGKPVTFTAIISIATGGTPGTPTGTVRFWDGAVGGTLLRTVTLVTVNSTTAKAVFKTTATQLSAGSHNIVADYLGDTKHEATDRAIGYTVNAAATLTKLTSNPQFWPLDVLTTFTATVSASSGGAPGVPSGTVTFVIDGANQAPVSLASGKATFSTIFASSTAHTVSAFYTPANGNFQTSAAAPQTQTVKRQSAVTFTSTSTNSGVILRAVVSTTALGGPPTGTVEFSKNGVLLGTATVNSSGVATIFLPLGSGSHTITARYSGDINFNPATQTKVVAGKLVGRLV